MKILLTSLLVLAVGGAAPFGSSIDGVAAAKNEAQVAANFSALISRLRRALSCTSGDYKVNINCYEYEVCIDGVWITKRCPSGMIFSNGKCRFFWEASCDPQSCIAGTNKVYPQDCTKYYHCDEDNNEVVTSCPSGFKWVYKYHFNPSSLQCEKVWNWKSCQSSSSSMVKST